ncbi:hypothetical protein BJ508DRAFT_323946 [Ascobolus immersus RN42]|uniref:Uncharacterized protein n=1 Tax=Ascobolus immersus RN42 TaxID=1160509 RepID=A0A3N4IIG9_ASCIM|nr:hypothetical protein BJ508DRAFT_323946 [Ascobolus immersus RN42]
MRISTFVTAAVALASGSVISAAPTPAELHKRALEVIYLSKCQYGTVSAGAQGWNLEVEFYENTNNSQNGQVPSTENRSTDIWTWEWEPQRPTHFATDKGQYAVFPTTTFSYDLVADAYSKDVGVDAGKWKATNGWHHDWVCKRDSGRRLYSVGGGANGYWRVCYAEFYCMH